MSDRTRRGLTLSWLVLFVLSILLQYGNLTNPSTTLAVHDDGLFELDGNALDQAAAGDDWENGTPGASASLFIPGSVEADGPDVTYFAQGGSKDHNDISDWEWSATDVAPDKDELVDVFAATYDTPDGTVVYFGADKFDDSGDAQIGFWFFQNAISLDADGTFNGVHAVGDVLVLSDFTNGGSVNLICVYEWNPPGGDLAAGVPDDTGCDLGDNLTLVAAGAECDVSGTDGAYQVCAIVNADDEVAPWPFENKAGDDFFGPGQFFEGGINLDELFGGDAPCFSSFLAETRSSAQVEAQLKDFALGTLNTCGSLTIIKDAIPNDAQDFAYTTTGGLSPATFSLDDDADATLSNTRVYSALEDGQYTVTEGLTANWQLTNLVCNDANGSVNLGTRTATINLGGAEHVTCTFTNTRYGRIIVDKVTNPGGSSQSFEFDSSYGANFFLTDAATPNDSGLLAPGTYSVAEVNIPAGWDLTSATCSDGSPVNAINLALNETVTCTFTNRQDGQIIVDKITDPSGSSQQFEFDPSWGSNFTLTDAQTPVNSGNLDPGTYSVVEIVPGGWDLSSISCSDGSANTAISLGAGETVTCTFNNRQDGRIIVVKQTTPDGSPQTFEFDPSWGANFFLTDGQSSDSGNLDPGTYSVAEVNIPTGWDLTGATCNDGSLVSAINLGAGEVVTCTFNNRQDGKIITVKQTTPDGSSQSFEFDPSWGTNFNLTDGQSNDSGFLDPGTHSVAEVNLPADWDLTGATCDDGSAVGSISLAAGEIVTCTFTNRQDGRIVIVKQTLPDGSSQSFEFDPSYAANFFLSDGQQNTSAFLDPGEYSVAEVNVPAGWDLTGATCDMGETVDDIDLGAGETVTCTFTNTQRGHIVVDKVTNPSGDPQSFSFDAGGSGYGDFSLTDAAAPNNQEVVPGSYSVSETVPSGWDLTSATCDKGETPSSLDVEPGETVTCTFTNTKRGTIIVEKQTSPDGAAGTFVFTGTAAGSIGDGGQIVVTNLVPGTYTSTEANPAPSFDLGAIVCSDADSSGNVGTRTATFDLDPGETVTCVFTNVQRGTITIIKNAVPDGPRDFSFTTTGSGLSGFSLDDDADGTLSNTKTFQNVVAGSYSVTEAAAAGWDLSSLVCNGAGGSSGTADGRTANITMTAGGSVTCTFTNSLPNIQVIKTASTAADGVEFVTVPGNVTYTYVVTNTGATILNGIVVRDDNGTPGNAGDDFTVTCPKSSLAVGESMTCTATVAVSANRTNIATATGTSPGGNTVSDTDDAVVRVPALVIAKNYTGNTGGTASNGMGIAKVGDTLTYTLGYDLSNGPVTNGVITDTLPTGLTYVAGSATNSDEFTFQSYNAATRTLTWTALTVTKDGSVTYRVTVDAGSFSLPQPLVNVATIDSDQTAKDDDTENVLVQTVLQETSAPTLPPTDAVGEGESAPSTPGFGLMLVLLALAGIGLATSYLVPAPARARRGEGRDR